MTMSIDALWAALSASGNAVAARRVDEQHSCDLYAALDPAGRPGLMLVTEVKPPATPVFEAVEVTVHQRTDGRWSLGVWLRSEPLASIFSRLCDDLVEATRCIARPAAPGYLLTRLVRWRKLLESGGTMSTAELRGLIGELVVFRQCLGKWSAADVVQSWVGPLDAPQDFTLPSLRIEAKAIRPGAATVRISSADQLDVSDAALLLAVVTLAPVGPGGEGTSAAALVSEIRHFLGHDGSASALLVEFDSRLAAGGYADLPEYEHRTFRIEATRFFEVRETFPRLRRIDLPFGISDASYEIALGVCADFETDLTS
jgi:hypothetical protein